MLGLANLGMRRGYFIGAFHPVGSNIIVMNKAPLEVALKSTDKQVYNAYCFHLLLHEYLHSLGYVSEETVRELTREVCKLSLGKKKKRVALDFFCFNCGQGFHCVVCCETDFHCEIHSCLCCGCLKNDDTVISSECKIYAAYGDAFWCFKFLNLFNCFFALSFRN
jgi:hypothetical protein